jgi:hypothetical protein
MNLVARRPAWALAALALLLCACGSKEPSRLTLHTPGATTGTPPEKFPLENPTPAATPTPTPTPSPQGGPVTSEEKRIIRGWSDELRHGHVTAAARYFDIPSLVSNGTEPDTLASKADVKEFNATLTCGAKLVKTRRSIKHFVIGTFQLTELPGGKTCGTGTGSLAEVAFLISRHHINQWRRVPDPEPDPTPAETPAPPDTT